MYGSYIYDSDGVLMRIDDPPIAHADAESNCSQLCTSINLENNGEGGWLTSDDEKTTKKCYAVQVEFGMNGGKSVFSCKFIPYGNEDKAESARGSTNFLTSILSCVALSLSVSSTTSTASALWDTFMNTLGLSNWVRS
jgi:hypothetical protein